MCRSPARPHLHACMPQLCPPTNRGALDALAQLRPTHTPQTPPIRPPGYYSGDEDAFDMRKAMPRDADKLSVVPLKKPVRPEDLEFE